MRENRVQSLAIFGNHQVSLRIGLAVAVNAQGQSLCGIVENQGCRMGRLKDLETAARIKLALIGNSRIGGLELGVQVVNGIVFLSGSVQDARQKLLAEDIALAHGGIDIKNDIKILAQQEEEALAVASDVNNELLTQIEDSLIRDRVIGDLESDGRVNALMINVDAAGGMVRLSGLQDTEEGRVRAEEIARRIPGVREVINEIEIKRAA